MPSSFHRFGLNPALVSRLGALGITQPTPAQLASISPIVRRLPQDRDDPRWSFGREALVLDAATGSGKTLAYLLPAADVALKSARNRVAVAAPSMTLAAQIRNQAAELLGPDRVELIDDDDDGCGDGGGACKNPNASIFIGQLKHLAGLPPSVIETLRCVVLDEADMILRPAGKYEPYRRMKAQAPKRQAALQALHKLLGGEANAPTADLIDDDDDGDDAVKSHANVDAAARFGPRTPPLVIAVSATANNRLRHQLKVTKLAHRVKVLSPSDAPFDLPPNLTHQYAIVNDANDGDRREIQVAPAIARLFRRSGSVPTLAVAPDGMSLDMLRASLDYEGVEALIVDEVGPGQLATFKASYSGAQILVGSARAIRGLDVPAIEHVIVAEVPEKTSDYVHIAGRTARMGRPGTVTTLASPARLERIDTFARELRVDLVRVPVDTVRNR